MSMKEFFSQPFSVQWRKALVSLPRMVPSQVLRYTSPEKPFPIQVELPSRGSYKIPLYIFVPPNIPKGVSEIPVIIDFHGGGFVLGGCLEQAPFCAKMSRDLGAIVITVDYRMGPIDKFPAAIEDGEDVIKAILDKSSAGYRIMHKAINEEIKRVALKEAEENKEKRKEAKKLGQYTFDQTRIAVSGFSSGGNLALNFALSVGSPQINREWPSAFPKDFQRDIPFLLYYPSLDARLLPSERTRPTKMPGTETSFWTTVYDMLGPTYLPRDQASHPRASPGLAPLPQSIHPKAKLLLVVPEVDTLAEQAETWAVELEKAGLGTTSGTLTIERYVDMKHGWTQFPEFSLTEKEKTARDDIWEKTVVFIRQLWQK